MIKLIAAVDNNWAIGKDGKLLYHAKADMKFFKDQTIGGVVVMGRKTLLTMPQCKPLPDRCNIILTRNTDFTVENAFVCNRDAEVLELIKKINLKNIHIIGGESIYRLFLDVCDEAVITKFNTSTDNADAFLSNLDEDEAWTLTSTSEEFTENNLTFTFNEYTKQNRLI